MIVWLEMLSCFFASGIRIFFCLYLVSALLDLPKLGKSGFIHLIGVTFATTAISAFTDSQLAMLVAEILILLVISYTLFRQELRMSFFIISFYEVAVALWEFLVGSGLGILFKSNFFAVYGTIKYQVAVWVVRLFMVGIAVFLHRKEDILHENVFRFSSIVAMLGMFGIIALPEQSAITLNDDTITTWLILSLVLIMSILVFKLNRQYETEKELATLKVQQAELLKRDFQKLNQSYSTNAKLFHDLHNHLEILHRFLMQGQSEQALKYLDDLHGSFQKITERSWTGDKATDYLINSKIALAKQQGIQMQVNIEFPKNTNLRSTDLTAILGNLLDNALEATSNPSGNDHFINLTIRRINDMLIIKVENDYTEISTDSNGNLQTTKTDGELHGWGLKSASVAAQRYDGTVETTCLDHIFCTVVTLSYDKLNP